MWLTICIKKHLGKEMGRRLLLDKLLSNLLKKSTDLRCGKLYENDLFSFIQHVHVLCKWAFIRWTHEYIIQIIVNFCVMCNILNKLPYQNQSSKNYQKHACTQCPSNSSRYRAWRYWLWTYVFSSSFWNRKCLIKRNWFNCTLLMISLFAW